MLDNSVGICFSELSDSNSHSNQNMPVLLGGSGGGKLKTGIVLPGSGAIELVHVSILQALGLTTQTFGRAKGPMPGLLV